MLYDTKEFQITTQQSFTQTRAYVYENIKLHFKKSKREKRKRKEKKKEGKISVVHAKTSKNLC